MIINHVYKEVTTDSGEATDTFNVLGECEHIVITPTTSTTQYDFKITNDKSLDIFEVESHTGTFNDFMTMPLSGIFTFTITNSTADEDFKVYISVRNI